MKCEVSCKAAVVVQLKTLPACACSYWGAPWCAQNVWFCWAHPRLLTKIIVAESVCSIGGTFGYRCVWRCLGEQNWCLGVQSEVNSSVPSLSLLGRTLHTHLSWAEWQSDSTNRLISTNEVCLLYAPAAAGAAAAATATAVRPVAVVHRARLCTVLSVRYELEVEEFQASVPEAWVRSQASPCDIFGGHSATGTGFCPSTPVFPCQYHSTNAPYPFIHLPPTLYNVSLPVLQFSPVSIIPPILHTHSFTYHPRCIMFFSQYFSFPLSVSFHQCSIHIN